MDERVRELAPVRARTEREERGLGVGQDARDVVGQGRPREVRAAGRASGRSVRLAAGTAASTSASSEA